MGSTWNKAARRFRLRWLTQVAEIRCAIRYLLSQSCLLLIFSPSLPHFQKGMIVLYMFKFHWSIWSVWQCHWCSLVAPDMLCLTLMCFHWGTEMQPHLDEFTCNSLLVIFTHLSSLSKHFTSTGSMPDLQKTAIHSENLWLRTWFLRTFWVYICQLNPSIQELV